MVTRPGKRLQNYWKSPFFYGKTHYTWPFSIAMLVYQRVPPISIGTGHHAPTWVSKASLRSSADALDDTTGSILRESFAATCHPDGARDLRKHEKLMVLDVAWKEIEQFLVDSCSAHGHFHSAANLEHLKNRQWLIPMSWVISCSTQTSRGTRAFRTSKNCLQVEMGYPAELRGNFL